nr:immunoglobulin heavy chain junction region [Macaca mulatta]
CAIRDYW